MLAQRSIRMTLVAALALSATACGDDDRLDLDARRRATRGISSVEAQALLERGPKRVFVELDPEGPAGRLRELEIRDDHLLFAEERVYGRLEAPGALAEEGCRGTLPLVPGVEVRFDGAITRFETEGTERSCADFATRLSALTEGGQPVWVMAGRQPGRFPRAPGDASFVAQRLRLERAAADDDWQRLELNVGPANLRRCAEVAADTESCVSALEVLGQTLIATRERTRLGTRFPAELILVDLDDQRVRRASVETREITLVDGAVVRLVDGTRIENGVEVADPLASLEELVAALDAGESARLGGGAMVMAGTPLTLLADRIRIERTDAADEPLDEVSVVQGFVDAVSPGAGTLRLRDGTTVQLGDDTELEGELADLSALAEALENDVRVRADVLGTTTAPRTIQARIVRLLLAPAADGGAIGPL